MRNVAIGVGTIMLVVGSVLVPTSAASAATYTLTAARASSGTAAADAASACTTQGDTATSHCAGYDTSLLATDQILRTGDTANVRFDFAFSASDTGVVLTSTIPTGNGGALGVWTGIPTTCATGSALSADKRTLTCRIASPQGAGDGSVTATLRLEAYAYDGDTFTVPAQISSDSSSVVNATSTATFTSSSAPLWNLVKTAGALTNELPAPFFYRSATGEPGFAIPTSTAIAGSKVGGYSPLSGPVTWTETMSSTSIDTSAYRLLNWGNYGSGCATQSSASTPANTGYTSISVPVSNQSSPVSAGAYTCTQPSGAGTPVHVDFTNPAVAANGIEANMWIMLWVPATAVPEGTWAAPTMTASGFDPDDINGVSNFFDATESTVNNGRSHGQIVNEDNRTIAKRAVADVTTPYATVAPPSLNTTTRGGSFQTAINFTNTGTVSQTPVQLCDVFDVTTTRLTAFAASGAIPANTYAVALTNGPKSDPIIAGPYSPASSYDNSKNFAVDTAAYTVEFAAGDLGAASPAVAPQTEDDLNAVTCGDSDTVTGWHSSPSDPAITKYASSLGLSDPFDVINRVRVTFTGGAVTPGQLVSMKLRFTARSEYRAATSQAGEIIPATTQLGDVGAHAYPQSTVDAWTKSGYVGPVIAGFLGVDTNVSVSANPTGVQAGAAGQDRTTYSVIAKIRPGEDVSPTEPLRVVDYLPVGMRYVAGSASRVPDQVLTAADGSTVLVWDLGLIDGTTDVVTTLPAFTFVAEADPLAPTPSTNYNMVISESVSATGEQIDTDVPGCVGTNAYMTLDIPATPTVPVATTTLMPPPANYTGCFGQGHAYRLGFVPVTIGNVFLSLAAGKQALSTQLESGADDGVDGAEVGWKLDYINKTSNSFDGVDIVDVLPYDGDGRDPESNFTGTIGLSSLTTSDKSSETPNALPASSTTFPKRSGTTFYVTDAQPASIATDPYDASNLKGGSTTWCLLTNVGTTGCPATLAKATALRAISGSLATQEERWIRIGLTTEGASDGDQLHNTAVARAIGLTTPVQISGDVITFVASSIDGTVWEDSDGDGTVGTSEDTRLANVRVSLTGVSDSGDAVTRTAATDDDGLYNFPGLAAGKYTVTVSQPDARKVNSAYALTYDPDGITSPDGSFTVDLPLNTTVSARDFGFATSSLAGTVFEDLDNNGAIDSGENGVSGVTVTLSGTNDLGAAVDRSATTGADGTYSFTNLRPGTYKVVHTNPDGKIGGQNVVGSAGGTGGDPGTDEITGISLEAAQSGLGYLFGELTPGIIQGSVFVDSDSDGTKGPGESGIGGVTITLYGATGNDPVTTQTLDDGTFAFAGLRPGTYRIVETQPGGYIEGKTTTGGSSGSVSGNTITEIVVGGSGPTEGYAFGEMIAAQIAGVVYEDLNSDGVRESGEPGISNTKVSLSGTDDLGSVTSEFTTGSDGSYLLSSLRPGKYTLTETQPAGYLDARERAGTLGGAVSNTTPGSNTISGIVVASGDKAIGYLFGDVKPASLSAAVFSDLDDDGARDSGENGIVGTKVTLTGVDDYGRDVSTSGTTASGGVVTFAGLRPGTYEVHETQPDAYFDGADTAGTAGGSVADDDISDITLYSGASATGYLFGERPRAAVSGSVFADIDGDGVRGATEAGIAEVTIELLGSDGDVLDSTTTHADGDWSFSDLVPGTYSVREIQPDHHIGTTAIVGTAGGTAGENTVTGIALNGAAGGYQFADIPLSIIGGTVWHDSDDDGVADSGEKVIGGVTVTLSGPVDRTVTTLADGTFLFGDLPPGEYRIVETQPSGWSDGRSVVGPDGGDISVKNTISKIVLGADESVTGYGFAERLAVLQLLVSTQSVDSSAAPGPYVAVGSTVRRVFTVVNNGDTTIRGIAIAGEGAHGVTCADTTVAPHSSVTCEQDVASVAGEQANSATVTGTVVPSGGGDGTEVVTASATSHYFGMIATASISATVNGTDATTAPGPVLKGGSAAAVVVTVTNTGNVPLALTTLDAGSLGDLVCASSNSLAPGASVECTTTWNPKSGNYTFSVAALLSAPDGTAVGGGGIATTAKATSRILFQVLESGAKIPPHDSPSNHANLAFTGLYLRGSIAMAILLAGAGVAILIVRKRRYREG